MNSFIIHCKTLKEAEEFMDCLGKRGVRWRYTSRILSSTNSAWKAYESTCYHLIDDYLYGWGPKWFFQDTFKEEKIYSFEEFMKIIDNFYPENKIF